MDLYCPMRGCGEPWENDSLHEEATVSGRTYAQVARDFRSRGCLALTAYGAKHNTAEVEPDEDMPDGRDDRAMFAAAAYDLLGGGAGGAAAMLEDMSL